MCCIPNVNEVVCIAEIIRCMIQLCQDLSVYPWQLSALLFIPKYATLCVSEDFSQEETQRLFFFLI